MTEDSTKIRVTNINASGEAEGEVLTVTSAGDIVPSGISQGTIDHGELDGLDGDDHTQYVAHALVDNANDFLVASADNTVVKKTLAETGAILEGDIDHDNLQGVESTEHFTEGSISHLNISDIGDDSHATIDSHIDSSTIHFTEGSISHLNISNIGTDSHATIDSHIDATDIHFDEIDELSDVSTATPSAGDGLIFKSSLWTPAGVAELFHIDNSRVSLNNSTSFLTWYSVTIPAGTLGAQDSVLVRAWGSNYNASGSNRSLIRQFQIICNGTTSATMVSDTQGSSSYYRPDVGEVLFINEGAVNNNFYYGYWMSHDQLLFGDKNQSTNTYSLTINVQSRWTNAHGSQTVYGHFGKTYILRNT